MTRVTAVCCGLLVLAGLTSCSGSTSAAPTPLPTDFSLARHDTRVFESYRVQAAYRTTTVRVPRGTAELAVHLVCRTTGDNATGITVDIGSSGGAKAECTKDVHAGYVSLSDDHPSKRARTRTLTVRAPEHATWSVAVDAGPDADR